MRSRHEIARTSGFILGCTLAFGLCALARAEPADPVDSEEPTSRQLQEGSRQSERAGAAADRRSPRNGIEEIRITARRRDEEIQRAPLTISAFSAEDLEDQGVTRLQDIARVVPNLQFDNSAGDANAARVYLRGVGNGDSIITDEAGVGITVDDVFLPRAAGTLLSITDVERVEVLAGPQATLYGKNTVGGLIRYISKKPEWAFGGNARVRIGNYDTLDTKLTLNVPLLQERLAMRLNLGSSYNEGFVRNRGPGRDRSRQERSLKAEVQFLLQATDDVQVLLKAYQSRNPNSGYSGKCNLTAGQAADSITGRLFGPNGTRGNFDQECLLDEERGPDKFSGNASLEQRLETYGSSLHVTWEPSDRLSFRSITAWGRNVTDNSTDGDATPLGILEDTDFNKDRSEQDAISQELTVSGLAFGQRMSWVAGVYGLVEKNQDSERGTANVATFANPEVFRFGPVGSTFLSRDRLTGDFNPISQATLNGALDANGNPFTEQTSPLRLMNGAGECIPGTEELIDTQTLEGVVSTCERLFQGIRSVGFRKSNVTSYAAYGQFDFDLTPKLKISMGVRYTHERKRAARLEEVFSGDLDRVQEQATINRGNRLNDFEFSNRFGRFSPSASIAYAATEDINLYALWGRGFKSGGFNGRGVGDSGELLSYDEEIVTNYEAGIKTRWFEDRLTVNASLFTQNYADIQLIRLDQQDSGRFVVVTDNVGDARINGFELSTVAIPTSGLTISANLGILAARFTKVQASPLSAIAPLVEPNNRLTGTPAYTGSVTVSYLLPLADFGDLRSTFTWSHEGKKESNGSNTEAIQSDKRGLLSGRVAFELADGKTIVSVFGNNILDREYVANGINAVRSGLLYFGAPRTFGIEVTRRF